MEYTRKKKLTFQIKDQKVGESIIGVYEGKADPKEMIDKKTGEAREVTLIMFHEKKNPDDKFGVWLNAGLKNALEWSGVSEGDFIEIVKLEPKKLEVGTVNQYDIFQLEA